MSGRLWDAVGGFLFLFAHMQEKLSKNSTQVDLLQELLNLQKDLITMLLSMLEGNVVNGTIGKQVLRYSDLPNRRIVVLNETMVKFCPIAKRDDPIN